MNTAKTQKIETYSYFYSTCQWNEKKDTSQTHMDREEEEDCQSKASDE
jgi:hypothetical protein